MREHNSVLIIDDDYDFVTAVKTLLESAGYQVSDAPDGTSGLQLAQTLQPDLILLDVMMTERTEGFFTLQRLRDTPGLERTPIVVVSSIYSELPHFRVDPQAGWLPASLFMAKPVDPPQLLAEVGRLIASRSPA